MKLNEIRDNKGSVFARKRVGRGIGSGTGKTAGAGHKGQHARSGVSLLGFEGGQTPLYRRMPKRGFNNFSRKNYAEINLSVLQSAIDSGRIDVSQDITFEVLKSKSLIKGCYDGVRLLGTGELNAKVTLEISGATKSAVSSVEKAGGSVKIVN